MQSCACLLIRKPSRGGTLSYSEVCTISKMQSPTKSPREGTALNVCETSPPDAVSLSSLCRADPSREELRAAEGCGVGRRCR